MHVNMFIFSFSEGTNMNEVIEYLDYIGHKLGIGGFEGVIGAVVLLFAAIFIIVYSASVFKGSRKSTKTSTFAGDALHQEGLDNLIEGRFKNPIDWMEDIQRTVGSDRRSKITSPGWDTLPSNIWHKKDE